MDAEAAKWILTLAGAGCEIIGLSLVILDARDARRAALEVLQAPKPVIPKRTEEGRWVSGVRRSIASYGAADDARQLREAFVRHIEGLGQQFQTLEDRLGADMEELSRRVVDESDQRERELRGVLADQLVSGLGRRWLGTGLFLVGVVLSAASNLVG
ncbi:hypothetical protein OJ997_29455 [Solirubrobacter phytolaccae]|uniref:Uncharacterized protein n=1 Tax=Solirubrobacter phytolaccae TaxID=1404360 RepID=A0A9X3NN12_9ACTN|nr:hypothetical protein [Solirubrobacter phytolaccae]MDA0184467.1 hypothetical protein [Solirubrobacter phytolaccae]